MTEHCAGDCESYLKYLKLQAALETLTDQKFALASAYLDHIRMKDEEIKGKDTAIAWYVNQIEECNKEIKRLQALVDETERKMQAAGVKEIKDDIKPSCG